MNDAKEIRSIWKLIILHLLPGIVLTVVYMFLLREKVLEGYPKLVLFSLAGFVTIVPLELGYLFVVAYKEAGNFNIFEILGLRGKMRMREFIFYTISLFIITGILMTALKPLSNFMLNRVFVWIPDWFIYVEDISLFNRASIMLTIAVGFFFLTFIGPIVEELYFRGYLLARMKWMGNFGAILNVLLFSIYHFWSPWLIVTRTVAFLPLFYFVQKKNSLSLAIFVHCLANFTDVAALIALL